MKKCIHCGSLLGPTGKCYQCGNESQTEILVPQAHKRSKSLTIFMGILIATSLLWIVLALAIISAADQAAYLKVVGGTLIFSASMDLIIAIFILRLKKWAFDIYIGLTGINCILRFLTFDFISVLIRLSIVYLIFRHDYEHFA